MGGGEAAPLFIYMDIGPCGHPRFRKVWNPLSPLDMGIDRDIPPSNHITEEGFRSFTREGRMRMCCSVVLAAAFLALASPPVFQNAVFVEAGGVDIKVSYYGSPCIYDWNGDGLKDLIVGEFTYGNIRLYMNSGTNAAPVFTTYTLMTADGVAITLPYG